jgi:hypothetical protein
LGAAGAAYSCVSSAAGADLAGEGTGLASVSVSSRQLILSLSDRSSVLTSRTHWALGCTVPLLPGTSRHSFRLRLIWMANVRSELSKIVIRSPSENKFIGFRNHRVSKIKKIKMHLCPVSMVYLRVKNVWDVFVIYKKLGVDIYPRPYI